MGVEETSPWRWPQEPREKQGVASRALLLPQSNPRARVHLGWAESSEGTPQVSDRHTPCKEASSQQHGHLGLPPAPRGPTCSLRARCCLKPLASTTFLFCSWATQPLLTSGLMPPGASTSQEHCLPHCSLPAPSLLPGAALGQADFAGGLFPSSGHAKSQQWLPDMMPQPQRGAGRC